MQILQTCGSRSWGGLEMQTLKISQSLVDRGHNVTLLCPRDSTLEKEARNQNIKVSPLFEKDLRSLSVMNQIKCLLQTNTYDIIHTHLSHDLWTLVPAMRWIGYKAGFFLTKRMASSLNKTDSLHRFLYQRLDGIFTISNFIRQNVIDTCPVKPEKVHPLLNSLDIDNYNPHHHDQAKIRKEFGIDQKTPVVGIVGRFTPMKGHIEFIHGAQQIKNKMGSNIIFLIVGKASYGEESYEREIRDLVTRLQLDKQVVFAGHRHDIPRVLTAIDILAFPSYKESFGNTLLEGMAMKLPIVASNSGAVPEIIIDGQTGLLVPPKDANLLAEKILYLLRNPAMCQKLGNAGRKRVEKYFKFDDYISKLERFYREKQST